MRTPALAAVFVAAVAAEPSPSLPVKVARLENGLRVVLHEDHRVPVVTVNLWYDVGSKDEPPGKSGLAHLFEHVMFQGSKHVADDAFMRDLERAGATDVNATTHTDRTEYFETVPANHLELALWLESDRMGFLLEHLDGQRFAVQREVMKNERRQSYESVAYGLVPSMVRAAMYPPGHPYHEPAIGSAHDLDATTLDDARAFFRSWYVPNNATLVIAGDIDPERTMALVQTYFAPIVPGTVPERRAVPPVVLDGEKAFDVAAGVELARVYVAWPAPAFFAPGDAELDLVARVLAGGKTSRLYERLVYRMGIAQDVLATEASAQHGSLFQIVATARPGHTGRELLAAIDDELAKVRADAPTDDELARARTGQVAGRILGLEKDAARAELLNLYAHYAGRPDYVKEDLARYAAATPSGLRDAAARWLPARARVVAFVVPKAGAPVAGGAP